MCAARFQCQSWCARLIAFNTIINFPCLVFSEDGDAPICPTIMTAQANPSFRLQPDSSNPQFRNGSYSEVPDNIIPGGQFSVENVGCAGVNDVAKCSRLSLLVLPGHNRPDLGRGSFTITYTASNQVTRRIDIEFGELNFSVPLDILKIIKFMMGRLYGYLSPRAWPDVCAAA